MRTTSRLLLVLGLLLTLAWALGEAHLRWRVLGVCACVECREREWARWWVYPWLASVGAWWSLGLGVAIRAVLWLARVHAEGPRDAAGQGEGAGASGPPPAPPCAACGYSRQGLDPRAACPECGAAAT